MTDPDDVLDDKKRNKPGIEIRRTAMNLLARREHAQLELVNKLRRRFSNSEALIVEQVEKLTREGLQSNERFVESFIRSRVNRGQGPVKIRLELRARGLDDSEISVAIKAAEVDWVRLVREVSAKRFGNDFPDDPKSRMKRIRFLQQRGFEFDQINLRFVE